jgi:uncharacterized SAM-binding protein YcdF (DUF218 family)
MPQLTVEKPSLLRRLWRCLIGSSGALGFLVFIVTVTPIDSWWARKLAGRWDDPQGEVLIVLGGGVLEDGMLGQDSYWRSVYAARVFREGGVKEIILAGGYRRDDSVAEAMRTFLLAAGVPNDLMVLENRSLSTRQNALFTKPLLTMPGKKILLTSDYHMFRASRVFAKAGLQVAPRPIPDILKRTTHWQGRWPAFLELSIETCKIVYYRMRGWI